MTWSVRANLRRRLRLALAGAAVVPPVEAQAPQTPLLGLGASPSPATATGSSSTRTGLGRTASGDIRPRTPIPGFLFDRGRFGRFDAPNAGIETAPNSIDNRGRIVGSYVDDDADATYHGFQRDARGRFTTVDLPGARATVASRINDRGQIVGAYQAAAVLSDLRSARPDLRPRRVVWR
jgi:hypothetical protein